MRNSAANRRSPLGLYPGPPTPRLYDCVVEALRTRHHSRRTEEAYLHWIRGFLAFHNGTHPREMAEMDVNRFLTHLAVGANAGASTQNQALAVVLFVCDHLPERPLDRVEEVVPVRKPKRLLVVLIRDEVEAIPAQLDGASRRVRMLLYGSGMRLLEDLGRRVKDLDLGRGEIIVRQGNGQKDCVTMLPGTVCQPLQDHLGRVREQDAANLKSGSAQAPRPDALARKHPNANREWGWQWVFPGSSDYAVNKSWREIRVNCHETRSDNHRQFIWPDSGKERRRNDREQHASLLSNHGLEACSAYLDRHAASSTGHRTVRRMSSIGRFPEFWRYHQQMDGLELLSEPCSCRHQPVEDRVWRRHLLPPSAWELSMGF